MRHRRGVTLIELLVVIAIITALSTLIVAVAPRFGERQRATRGAAQIQSWLNLAKQRALRDQRPVGLRLIPSSSPYITNFQYVEGPDEYIGGTITVPDPTAPNPPNYSVVRLSTASMFNPKGSDALIQGGDVLLILRMGYSPRRIVSVVQPNAGVPQYQVLLDRPLPPTAFGPNSDFRVYRSPRPVVGEPILQLPKDIAVDVDQEKPDSSAAWYRLYPALNSGGGGPLDIMFAPSGQLTGALAVYPRVSLWVRDVSLNTTGPNVGNDPNRTDPTILPPGENTLITVNTRTGNVASHPIDPSGLTPRTTTTTWNPFRFTQDGLSSGQ